jgi:hypothetical protein
MSQPPTEQEIEKLLEQLKTGNAPEREQAAQALGKSGIRDTRIVNALKEAKSHEAFRTVIEAIDHALVGSSPVPKLEHARDFAIGFFGWFAFNIAMIFGIAVAWFAGLWGYFAHYNSSPIMLVCNALNFLGNILGIPLLGLKRRWIALGALVAFAGTMFVMVLVSGLAVATDCFRYFVGLGEYR